MSINRTLTFNWTGVTKKVDIVLCFTPLPNPKLGIEQNPVAWHVITPQTGDGGGSTTIQYASHAGLGNDEICHDNIVGSPIKVDMNVWQSKVNVAGDTLWEAPGVINASLGRTVGPSMFVEPKFQPVLKAYVNLGDQKNQFLSTDIASEAIWGQDLSVLKEHSSWDIIETPQGYEIKPAVE